jgi:hypothetical protein
VVLGKTQTHLGKLSGDGESDLLRVRQLAICEQMSIKKVAPFSLAAQGEKKGGGGRIVRNEKRPWFKQIFYLIRFLGRWWWEGKERRGKRVVPHIDSEIALAEQRGQ